MCSYCNWHISVPLVFLTKEKGLPDVESPLKHKSGEFLHRFCYTIFLLPDFCLFVGFVTLHRRIKLVFSIRYRNYF